MAVHPDIIAQVGRLVYGDHFLAPMARDLPCNPRNLSRWLSGESDVPEGLGEDVLRIWDGFALKIRAGIRGCEPVSAGFLLGEVAGTR
jgi:hypothetical protein